MGRPKIPPAARIAKYGIRDPSGCLIWTGAQTRDGYGKVTIPRDGEDWRKGTRTTNSHILAWELAHGPVPDGLTIDHKCRVRLCCEVEHLRLLSSVENVMIGEGGGARNARKVVCHKGHDDWKEYQYHGKTWRQCRTCQREYQREWQRARRAKS